MNKRITAAVALCAVVLGGAPGASAYSSMGLMETQALSFGTFAASNSAGTVILAPGGTRTATGGVIPINTNPGQAGIFDVTGDPTATNFSITLSSSETLSNGSTTMLLDSFVTSPPIGLNGTLTNGHATLYVGGTLHVEANQPRGSYAGTYTVTVDYY